MTPSLAPFYDLLSTAAYEGLTTRLAMSIDGATHLGEVSGAAWAKLASDVGFAPRFLKQRMEPFAERVIDAVADLSKRREHAGPVVEMVAGDIGKRAEYLRLGASS